jgi:hypothetical protein
VNHLINESQLFIIIFTIFIIINILMHIKENVQQLFLIQHSFRGMLLKVTPQHHCLAPNRVHLDFLFWLSLLFMVDYEFTSILFFVILIQVNANSQQSRLPMLIFSFGYFKRINYSVIMAPQYSSLSIHQKLHIMDRIYEPKIFW